MKMILILKSGEFSPFLCRDLILNMINLKKYFLRNEKNEDYDGGSFGTAATLGINIVYVAHTENNGFFNKLEKQKSRYI